MTVNSTSNNFYKTDENLKCLSDGLSTFIKSTINSFIPLGGVVSRPAAREPPIHGSRSNYKLPAGT